jgi:hypothetical protein
MVTAARRNVRQSPARPVKSEIPEVEELSRQVTDLQRQWNPFARGVELNFAITTGPGTVTIEHKLGRIPEGWILTRIIAFQPTEFSEAPSSATSRVIVFQSMLPCSGKVWVY